MATKVGCKFKVIANPIEAALSSPGAEEEKDLDVKKEPYPDIKFMVPKTPVVTLVGHVDHGKTTVGHPLSCHRISVFHKEESSICHCTFSPH